MLKAVSNALCLTLALFAAGCGSEGPTSPIVFVGPANLVVTDVRVGDGATLTLGQQATVHYGLWLYDPTGTDLKGRFIEGTRESGGQPFTTRLAAGTIIQGWIDGVPGMRVGGLRRLLIPPSLAYGDLGNGPIPPNAWIIFDVELIAVAD